MRGTGTTTRPRLPVQARLVWPQRSYIGLLVPVPGRQRWWSSSLFIIGFPDDPGPVGNPWGKQTSRTGNPHDVTHASDIEISASPMSVEAKAAPSTEIR